MGCLAMTECSARVLCAVVMLSIGICAALESNQFQPTEEQHVGVCAVSQPDGSNDAGCTTLNDRTSCVSAPGEDAAFPATPRGIGYIVSATVPSFVTHDHRYVKPHVPEPGRAQVTFVFNRPTLVEAIEIVQHSDGISHVEGFVASTDEPDKWTSIGMAEASARPPYNGRPNHVMKFTDAKRGDMFRVVVRRTPNPKGWASYQWWPVNAEGRITGATRGSGCRRDECKVKQGELGAFFHPAVCAIATQPNSQDATCTARNEGASAGWCISANPLTGVLPITGISKLAVPSRAFGLHDHVYTSEGRVAPGRGEVIFMFNAPIKVGSVSIYQHTNGIDEVEGFVQDEKCEEWTSIGVARAPTRHPWPEHSVSEFRFPSAGQSSLTLKIVVKRSGLKNGWATYSWVPRDVNGFSIEPATSDRSSCGGRGDACQRAPFASVPVICAVAAPKGSQDATCRARQGYCASANGRALNDIHSRNSIADLVNSMHFAHFGLHDHRYSSPHVPSSHNFVVYVFNSRVAVKGVMLSQHSNGITAVEGWISDTSSSQWKSLGVAHSSRGKGPFPEHFKDFFHFRRGATGNRLKIRIARTHLPNGWATYRIIPFTADTLLTPSSGAKAEGCPKTDPCGYILSNTFPAASWKTRSVKSCKAPPQSPRKEARTEEHEREKALEDRRNALERAHKSGRHVAQRRKALKKAKKSFAAAKRHRKRLKMRREHNQNCGSLMSEIRRLRRQQERKGEKSQTENAKEMATALQDAIDKSKRLQCRVKQLAKSDGGKKLKAELKQVLDRQAKRAARDEKRRAHEKQRENAVRKELSKKPPAPLNPETVVVETEYLAAPLCPYCKVATDALNAAKLVSDKSEDTTRQNVFLNGRRDKPIDIGDSSVSTG